VKNGKSKVRVLRHGILGAAELVSSARVLDNTPLKMRRILGRIERLLKKGGER